MHKKKSVFQLIRDNAYYIALGVCVLAVIVSGFLFLQDPDGARSTEGSEVPAAALPDLREPPAPGEVPTEEPAFAPAAETETQASPTETEAPKPQPLTILRPLEGEVLQCFSMDQLRYNPTTRDWRTHAGLDLAAALGTPVRAAAEGTVSAVYEDDLLGQTVTVQHAQGYVTRYANLDPAVSVRAGETVSAGQELGTVGKTALVEIGSEPHLHFSVYRDNVAQDPEEFLSAAAEPEQSR